MDAREIKVSVMIAWMSAQKASRQAFAKCFRSQAEAVRLATEAARASMSSAVATVGEADRAAWCDAAKAWVNAQPWGSEESRLIAAAAVADLV